MIPALERFLISDRDLFSLKQQYVVLPFTLYLKAPKEHWIDSQGTRVLSAGLVPCEF